jgi:pantoate ligase/cytidylate kinase
MCASPPLAERRRERSTRALDAARAAFSAGASRVAQVRRAALEVLNPQPAVTLEYLDLADPQTLEALSDDAIVRDGLITIAVTVEGVRLIDECLLAERRSERATER